MQVTGEDDTSEEVIEVPTPKVPEAAEASTGISSAATPIMAEPMEESDATLRE